MKDDFLAAVRTRSREEWGRYFIEQWRALRIWVQEHGEPSLVLGVLLGIIAVIAFKVVVVLGVVLALFAGVVWFLAEPNPAGNDESSDFYRKHNPPSPETNTWAEPPVTDSSFEQELDKRLDPVPNHGSPDDYQESAGAQKVVDADKTPADYSSSANYESDSVDQNPDRSKYLNREESEAEEDDRER